MQYARCLQQWVIHALAQGLQAVAQAADSAPALSVEALGKFISPLQRIEPAIGVAEIVFLESFQHRLAEALLV